MTAESSSTIVELPPLRDIIRDHGLRAEKSLGQNFLLDLNLTAKIARVAKTISNKTVFEIGPGPGGLTRALLMTDVKKLIAIEYDSRAISALQSLKDAAKNRLEVIHGDALNVNLDGLAKQSGGCAPYAVVANLPYNIATPLLIGWLEDIYRDEFFFSELVLMFQKEVAQRIVAKTSNKSYGRLSILAQWLCDVKLVFDVPSGAFTPPPKVTSSIVRFTPKKNATKDIDFKVMEEITAAAFGQRRKMIRGSLKDYMDHIESCGLRAEARAEELTIDDFIALAKSVTKARL